MLEQYPQFGSHVRILDDSTNEFENYLKDYGRQFVGFSVQWWMGIDDVQEEHTERIKELAKKLEDNLNQNPNLDIAGLLKMKQIIKIQHKVQAEEVNAEVIEKAVE